MYVSKHNLWDALESISHPDYGMRVSGGVPESKNGSQRLVTNRRQTRLIRYASIAPVQPHGFHAH